MALVAGCGPSSRAEPASIELAAVSATRVASTTDDASRVGAAVTAFGLDVYGHVAAA